MRCTAYPQSSHDAYAQRKQSPVTPGNLQWPPPELPMIKPPRTQPQRRRKCFHPSLFSFSGPFKFPLQLIHYTLRFTYRPFRCSFIPLGAALNPRSQHILATIFFFPSHSLGDERGSGLVVVHRRLNKTSGKEKPKIGACKRTMHMLTRNNGCR